MKGLPAVLISLALISTTVYAQSAPPAPNPRSDRPEDNWTGLHVGASVGHLSQTFSEFALLTPSTGDNGSVSQPGVSLGPASAGRATIGVAAGYDVRLARRVVGGAEIQITGRSPVVFGLGNGIQDDDVRSFRRGISTSIRSRAGAAVTRGLLIYGTVGVAMTHVTAAGDLPGVTVSPASAMLSGVTLGAGGECKPWARGPLAHVAVGAEFRRVGSNREGFPLVSLYVPAPISGTLTSHADEFDVRVNYRFSVKTR